MEAVLALVRPSTTAFLATLSHDDYAGLLTWVFDMTSDGRSVRQVAAQLDRRVARAT